MIKSFLKNRTFPRFGALKSKKLHLFFLLYFCSKKSENIRKIIETTKIQAVAETLA
jgi:hypothetical protein